MMHQKQAKKMKHKPLKLPPSDSVTAEDEDNIPDGDKKSSVSAIDTPDKPLLSVENDAFNTNKYK